MHLPLAFLLLFVFPLANPSRLSAAPAASIDPAQTSRLVPAIVDGASTPAVVNSKATPTSADADDKSTPSVPSHAPASTTAQSASTHTTHKPPLTAASKKHGVPPHTQPAGQITRPGSPTRLPGPTASHAHPFLRPHAQSTSVLVFEIIGALAGVAFVLTVVRCIWSYRRTPAADRIAAILHRHQLQREMEELERNPPERHQSLREPPPPPYLRPPSYDVEADERALLTQVPPTPESSPPSIPGPLPPSRPNG
ncbi:hypothetical protein C8F04DRAFT_1174418 [Mycena alexandri]|uniref:Transmembrane protein n=1 Tax=Mycena alexandri TaxID=1745969 RepID=A0AAD6TI22_9AGAR|nr:hypothetical protein C8F04DRAFT_1174418 [Mycena alexandri]